MGAINDNKPFILFPIRLAMEPWLNRLPSELSH